MPRLRVLIAGASIAGPTAAYWFAKAGADVTIIERFPAMRTGGQNVDIRSVGVTVMRKMPGMEAAVLAKPAGIDGISFVRADGRSYGTIKPTGNPDQQSLISEYEIYRGDLAQILFDMTKDNQNIKYVFGEQVVSMRQHGQEDGPITVEFANGLPTSEYDLVVACDGATSRTRALGLGCGVRDHIKPLNGWVAFCSVSKDLAKGNRIGQGYNATGGRMIAIGPGSSGESRVTMMKFYPRTDQDASLPFRQASKRGDTALRQFVAQEYEGVGWKAAEAIQAMMETDDFYATELVQVKIPSLYQGRFVLVGDAGYAPGSTGTGTSLAMAGAYVLAGEISKHKGDIAAGLKCYEETMRPILEDLQQELGFAKSILAPQTAWGIWLRNHIFAFVVWSRILDFVLKFFAAAFASNDKHKLQDYEWVD
ncbi:uncharacterized protein JN550_005256 [Neoarthrinium moseri]|uniref:uncharacterized protein n=1 Tax=Neoarthrinium moseri TaxID=1658444 RepID=UPI001FDC3810|nr:uncharacterized protein JN550_005256 [Neoarthrinium moseri]KAI1870328.1 hypothetical protein JN550_005256 [Neoarthrinium moseri]